MSEVFNLSTSTIKTLNDLYDKKAIDSKELFVQLGLAVGIATGKKAQVKNPKPFHTLAEIDKGRVFTIIANTRNLDLVTEEQVARELEMYAEAGMNELIERVMKDGTLNYYRVLKKYSER